MATARIPIFLPDCALDAYHQSQRGLHLTCHSSGHEAICPECGVASASVHSYYERNPCDWPVNDQPVRLILCVRRFRCLNIQCQRCTFAEPLPDLLLPYARRTTRLKQAQCAVAMALGGQAGSRLLSQLHMPTRRDALLRLIRRWPLPDRPTPRVLGVDDWSIRKHVSYGTILLDLEQHHPIELLRDRTSETLRTWLQAHPGVEIIARDRSSEYARGAREGAPQALQVADRWHLLHNLKQMLDRFLGGIHTRLRKLPAVRRQGSEGPEPTRRLAYSIRDVSSSERARGHADRQRRLACYEQVKRLYHAGWKIKQMERALGIDHKTVWKYVYAEAFPERAKRHAGRSIRDPYLAYLEARHSEGCEHALQRWREIQAQGYPGSRSQVSKWMGRRRSQRKGRTPSLQHTEACSMPALAQERVVSERVDLPPARLPSASQLAWLIMRSEKALHAEEQEVLQHSRQDATVEQVYGLSRHFVHIVRKRTAEQLDGWLEASKTSGITVLQHFALSLARDYEAVRAALETAWSNGQTEGQITRLKFIKRQMYGRAKFDLLRQRVLYAA